MTVRPTAPTGTFSRTAALAAAVALAACSTDPAVTGPSAAPARSAAAAQEGGPEFVPGEVLVKFRAGASAEGRGAALRSANAQVGERILTATMRRGGDAEGVTLVRTGLGVQAAIAALRASGDVEYAEPNWIYQHNAVSNDPSYTSGSLWGMYGHGTSPANQYGSQAGEAWARNKTDCSSVYVGIIDEGYMYTHEDLAANAGKNLKEVEGNGVDDDGNGYVDDVYGWDFDGNNNTVFDGTGDDHGTHVAGTIGGVGGNGKGVAGVCWSVKLLGAKFLGSNGGTTANAIKAVDYFTDLKTRNGLNLVATNNSWGGGGFSQALLDAINRAGNAGILFIAAAGNGGFDGRGDDNDKRANYPSNYQCTANGSYDCVIAVASITSTGARSSFSNYGARTVDIGAPGSGIHSTLPNNTYGSYSGTSMATPHVTGGAALYASTHSGATAKQIRDAILSSAIPTASLSGRTVTGGRLNVSGF
jgi:subtilisin family serine protease